MTRRGRPPTGPVQEDGRPSRLSSEQELILAAVAAEKHYLQQQTMAQIAEDEGLTRFQVARLLQLARSTGIVTIEVKTHLGADADLSRRLAEALEIESAVVLGTATDDPRAAVARTLAQTLSDAVVPDATVGLTWSRTLLEMATQLRELAYSDYVQLAGHISLDPHRSGSVEIVRRAADLSGGLAYPIYAPLFAPDGYVADALRAQPDVLSAIERYATLDIAVVSIGSWGETGSSIFNLLTDEERTRAARAGAIGEISGRLFSTTGPIDDEELTNRTIGITLPQLANVPRVIASSYGADRAKAVIAAARAGYIHTLVADRSLALAVLAEISA